MGTAAQLPRNGKRSRQRRGQSLIEYLLITAMMATLAMGFNKFYGTMVLGGGLKRLPAKVGACISQGDGGDCQ